MDKPEVIHRMDTGPHEVLRVKEVVFEKGVLYGILSAPEWMARNWNPTPDTFLDKNNGRGEFLTPEELDALCAWWQARRPATILDKSALEALVKQWRETARRLYPDTGAKYSNIRRAGVYDRCADELEGLLSSAKPDVLIASPITAELLWTEAEIRDALTEASIGSDLPTKTFCEFVLGYLNALRSKKGSAPDA